MSKEDVMRIRIVGIVALTLGLAIAPAALAQGDKASNNTSTEAKTICGVVAGVTAEGETVFDFASNRAVTVDAGYITVVGSPKTMDRDNKSSSDAKSSGTDKKREDTYIVWLSPKTKVCECSDSSGKSTATKDCSFDRLEIGDRVEVAFVPRNESQSGTKVQNDKAKMKHGRHRTHVGEANSITIMPSKSSDNDSKDSSKTSNKDSKDSSKTSSKE
jgi:hypothetical protein